MKEERKEMELTPEEAKACSRAGWAHILPFVAWLTLMVWLGDPSGVNYAIRTVVCGVLLLVLRPWKWYPKFNWKNLPAAIGVGVFIFLVWVGFESAWMLEHAPRVAGWYDRLFVDFTHPFKTRELFALPSGKMVPYETLTEGPFKGLHVYNPSVTGWILFAVHMLGTSVVIAVIEEFFFRGLVYRWMFGSPFYKVDPGRLNWGILLMISVFFGVEHVEWMAGIICGIAYGLLYIKTRDIWAAIWAHGITNFLLGWYVVKVGAYQFW